MKKIILILCLFTLPFVSGCARIELASHFGKKMMGTHAHSKGYYKIGSPYRIKGIKYYPAVDYDYDKKGIASWYGPNFHGKMTANGETYNQNDLTAAHKTLPLPSIVRVTNLDNGKSIIVRVNDRGPYARGRIIDMSKRGAELLDFKRKGVVKVRVKVLEAESRMVAKAAQNGQDTRGMEIPMNKRSYKTPVRLASESRVIPGHIEGGNFYPDPVISEYAVGTPKVFIQTGSFTSRSNAMKFASSLDKYGRARVHSITIDGAKYYRVRLPAPNITAADGLLERVLADGYKNSRIIVD